MNYTKRFEMIKELCQRGKEQDIDEVMFILSEADLPETRAVDFYLGKVMKDSGLERLEYYLFNGTQIQRNYCTLFFARRNEWKLINKAYDEGLIDYLQAYSR